MDIYRRFKEPTCRPCTVCLYWATAVRLWLSQTIFTTVFERSVKSKCSSHVTVSNHLRFSPVHMHTLAMNIRNFCMVIILHCNYLRVGRSQWRRGLKRRSAAARLLRSWVRIPTVCVDMCLLWVLCVARYRSLRRTDHSSRGVLPTVLLSLCVI
jgi:hypothetical protein